MKSTSIFKIISSTALLIFNLQAFSAHSSMDSQNVISDSVITAKVKSKLVADPQLSVFQVDVNTNDGVVTLVGTVNSDTDAGALIQMTQSTEGVRDVDTDKLDVKNSKHPIKDMAITAKVKGMFIREKLLGKNIPASVGVETNNGIVYLSGKVDSRQQLDNAILVAKAIHGVKNVESRVKVVGK